MWYTKRYVVFLLSFQERKEKTKTIIPLFDEKKKKTTTTTTTTLALLMHRENKA